MTKILFVCTGNICRSPTAEGVARHAIRAAGLEGVIKVESAGTHGYHVGEAPDPRSCKAAAKRGYDLSTLRARKLEPADFEAFDLLLAMDAGHLEIMERNCPEEHRGKVRLFMSYARRIKANEVLDPYYGGDRGFELVLDYCEDAVEGLLDVLLSSR